MGQGINTLSLELDDKEALALAQFVKRLTWSECRSLHDLPLGSALCA